jgi:hypothetical protein
MALTIDKIRDVLTENPTKQVWKHLRFFLDESFVEKQLRQLHAIPIGKFLSDVKKQAKQIHACIRQAEEYFQASSRVGLPTRPVLLYYGAVSLSQALVLMRGNGDYSLDKLRKNKQHRHHGLEIDLKVTEMLMHATSVEEFFSQLQCKVHLKLDKSQAGQAQPWGQFPLFYQNLVPEVFHVPIEFYEVGRNAHTTEKRVHPCADYLPINKVAQKDLNGLSLLKTLPDMYSMLLHLGIITELARGDVEVKILAEYEKTAEDSKKLKRRSEDHTFYVNYIHAIHKSEFLAFYAAKNPELLVTEDRGNTMILRFKKDYPASEEAPRIYYPDIVEDINGLKYFLSKPAECLPETASYFVLLYCLGTVARYFPDQWIRTIERNVHIAEVIDTLLNIVYRKFPNLILDQLTLTKHHIHS